MPPNNTISGKGLGGMVGANTISGVYRYTLRVTADELDGTVGSDAGYTRTDTGCLTGEISLSCVFDLAEAAFVPFAAGEWLEDLTLYDDLLATPFATIPYAKITSAEKTGEVRGRLEYTITAKTWGSFTLTDPSYFA